VRQADVPGQDSEGGPPEPSEVVIALVASLGPATDLAAGLLSDLSRRATERLPGSRWAFRLLSDRLVEWPADLQELASAARRRLVGDVAWDAQAGRLRTAMSRVCDWCPEGRSLTLR
jgi:hypothetical protein